MKWILQCTSKLRIVIMISYTSQFSVIGVSYRKEQIISVNISINNFTVYFKGNIVVKLSPWFCNWIEFKFCVYLPFILHQFVTRDSTISFCKNYCMLWSFPFICTRVLRRSKLYDIYGFQHTSKSDQQFFIFYYSSMLTRYDRNRSISALHSGHLLHWVKQNRVS